MPSMKRTDKTTIRFDNANQLDLIKKAAKLKHWAVNRFMIEAALEAAKSVTANPVSEPLMVKREPLPLNQ